jgi:NADP-dependent 3-hydroxy acid dehydrogenase YdfG
LGSESARALAKTGAHVILAARNRQALADTEAWLRADVPDAVTSAVQLDLTSLASVRSAAQSIGAVASAIHVLMNNAG